MALPAGYDDEVTGRGRYYVYRLHDSGPEHGAYRDAPDMPWIPYCGDVDDGIERELGVALSISESMFAATRPYPCEADEGSP